MKCQISKVQNYSYLFAAILAIEMKYLAAYMLSAMACGEDPSFEKIQGVLATGGLGVDADNLRLVINS
uniref:60S acidic ribosomal protein P2 n=1 Tax=Ditylenchus dipsaci TaxID=166011 RepID=A0A915ERK8_9BILA